MFIKQLFRLLVISPPPRPSVRRRLLWLRGSQHFWSAERLTAERRVSVRGPDPDFGALPPTRHSRCRRRACGPLFGSQNCPSCRDHLHPQKRRAAFVPVATPERRFYSAAPSQWPLCDKGGLMDGTEGGLRPAAGGTRSLFSHSVTQDGARCGVIAVTFGTTAGLYSATT